MTGHGGECAKLKRGEVQYKNRPELKRRLPETAGQALQERKTRWLRSKTQKTVTETKSMPRGRKGFYSITSAKCTTKTVQSLLKIVE